MPIWGVGGGEAPYMVVNTLIIEEEATIESSKGKVPEVLGHEEKKVINAFKQAILKTWLISRL